MADISLVHFKSARSPSPLVATLPVEQWPRESLVTKMVAAFQDAMAEIVHPGDVVAVKVHLGERYSERYLRPTYVRHLVEAIRDRGGKPFVTDTLLRGSAHATSVWTRRGVHEAMETMARNGFTTETVGAPIIFADAMNKTDGIPVKVGGRLIQTAYIAPLLADADVLISLAHFKGHDCAAFGGQMKALGVGCQSKRGKFWVHCEEKIRVVEEKCDGCGKCLEVCPTNALARRNGHADAKVRLDPDLCTDCEQCLFACPQHALAAKFAPLGPGLCARIGEAAAGIVNLLGKDRCGFINVAIDITPLCDCDPFTDVPFVQDIGVFASRDPVAVDRAAVDMVTALPGLPASMAEDVGVMAPGAEKLNAIARLRWLKTPGATDQAPDWRGMLAAAEGVGLGTQGYRLVADPETISPAVRDWLLSREGDWTSACQGVVDAKTGSVVASR